MTSNPDDRHMKEALQNYRAVRHTVRTTLPLPPLLRDDLLRVRCTHSSSPSLAGETFCGIAALQLLGRLPSSSTRNVKGHRVQESGSMDGDFVEHVTRWLVHRQTLQLHEEGEEEDECEELDNQSERKPNRRTFIADFKDDGFPAATLDPHIASVEASQKKSYCAGFSGRCNKVADTCYAWWVGSSLAMLHRQHLQDFNAVERYLLDKTQHRIGGFGKMPGDAPGKPFDSFFSFGDGVNFIVFPLDSCQSFILASRLPCERSRVKEC